MCVYIHIYIHTYIHIYVYIYIHIYVYTYMLLWTKIDLQELEVTQTSQKIKTVSRCKWCTTWDKDYLIDQTLRRLSWTLFQLCLTFCLSLHCPILAWVLLSTLPLPTATCPAQYLMGLLFLHHPPGNVWSPWPAFSKNPVRLDWPESPPHPLMFPLSNSPSTDPAPWP